MWIRRKEWQLHVPDPHHEGIPPPLTYGSSNQNGAGTGVKSFVEENRAALTSTNKSYSWSSSGSAASCEADTSDASSFPSSLAASYGGGWWFEEEKAFPLKKRRNSLRRFTTTQLYSTPGKEIKKPIEAKQKSKEDEDEEEEEDDGRWRCKRNSGKGWRCRMRRMGGRAYCEHHVIMRTLAHRDASRSTSGAVKLGNVKKYHGLEKEEEHEIGKMCKKKTRMMTISSILDRAVPVIEEEV